jgi:hypothetical protein
MSHLAMVRQVLKTNLPNRAKKSWLEGFALTVSMVAGRIRVCTGYLILPINLLGLSTSNANFPGHCTRRRMGLPLVYRTRNREPYIPLTTR